MPTPSRHFPLHNHNCESPRSYPQLAVGAQTRQRWWPPSSLALAARPTSQQSRSSGPGERRDNFLLPHLALLARAVSYSRALSLPKGISSAPSNVCLVLGFVTLFLYLAGRSAYLWSLVLMLLFTKHFLSLGSFPKSATHAYIWAQRCTDNAFVGSNST